MKRDDKSLDSKLDRYMGQAGEPPAEQVASSVEAVWERLRPEAECATPQIREVVTRRSHFTVVAAIVIVTVAIGLYAAQRSGLLQPMLPVQPQAQLQPQTPPKAAPALQNPSVSVNPAHEPMTIAGVAESKKATSELPQTAAAVADATRPQRTGADTLQFTAAPVQASETKRFMTSPEQLRSQGATIPAAPLAFEVAAVRLVPPPHPSEGGPWIASNGRFSADRAWVRGLVAVAYDLNKALLVKGGPDWINQERYDVDARAGSAAAGQSELRQMLRTLMTERFKLAVHRSTEEAMVYTLAVAKNGSKLQAVRNPLLSSTKWNGPGRVTFSDTVTLIGLINVLGGILGVPVFDETGLSGTYTFSLEFTDPRDPRPRTPDSPPDIFTAVQEQLGLELRATRRPVEFIVIDHIERPLSN